jgi:hypothetical protein
MKATSPRPSAPQAAERIRCVDTLSAMEEEGETRDSGRVRWDSRHIAILFRSARAVTSRFQGEPNSCPR